MLVRFLVCLLLSVPAAVAAGTILVVGDSLSSAYGIPIEKGWVNLLQEKLDDHGFEFTLVNASISGDTTANGRNRLPRLLASHAPDAVLLEFGGNDGLRAISPVEIRKNLAAMIEMVKRSGARLLLIGVQLPPNYGSRYTRTFDSVFIGLSEQYGVPLMPSIVAGIGTESRLMQADGIHPNVAAQPLIRDRVWSALLPLLRPDPTATPHRHGPTGR